MKKRKKISIFDLVVYLIVGSFSLLCLYPFLMVIGGSLSTQSDLIRYGYRVIPRNISFAAYKALFMNKQAILNGYTVTIIVTVVGTTLSLIINSMMGFVLSCKHLRYRKILNIYTLLTMLFSGGMVPWYIVCVRYLNLKDTIFALILPSLVGGFNIFLLRNYFNSIPEEMYEAAKMDGAGDFVIFSKIYVHLSKPVLATITLFTSLAYWNDWFLGLMLVDKTKLQPLQLLLRNITSNIQFLQTMNPSPELQRLMNSIPGDAIRMAMVIVTIGPIILVYPFIQKYFVKGIMVGAVKG
jgi:putative aldouronate transport system permease protein